MEKQAFIIALEVKYRDTDSMGHVSSPVYYEYIQHAYVKYMHSLLAIPYSEKLPQIMVKTCCEYIAPAILGDNLEVSCRVVKFGSKSFEIQYQIHKSQHGDKTLIAQATSTHVCFDYQLNQSIPVPEDMKQRVTHFQDSL
ncbi:acyl-CoA thioesterase [Serratia fonticola]|uniref:Acyl-CoA thioesterase n=1 Tax=Serratia fonticola TaxID=47917 RepID=A0AAW3WVZ6_SERFO|nr:thioesterase family protein [Serratia fonticola]MBC3214900.1 acyl-CoA thioesterase [Serratia fonticola]NYA15469.1 acyl-CoA thioesterase [Serratia fonticola]NYA35576.1 acyl-CoA thioesterase [Serratia fonticola]